jgi:hypothetical protein
MRVLSITEIECIVNRVLRRDDIFVMVYYGSRSGQIYPSPAQMVINHGFSEE